MYSIYQNVVIGYILLKDVLKVYGLEDEYNVLYLRLVRVNP